MSKFQIVSCYQSNLKFFLHNVEICERTRDIEKNKKTIPELKSGVVTKIKKWNKNNYTYIIL